MVFIWLKTYFSKSVYALFVFYLNSKRRNQNEKFLITVMVLCENLSEKVKYYFGKNINFDTVVVAGNGDLTLN